MKRENEKSFPEETSGKPFRRIPLEKDFREVFPEIQNGNAGKSSGERRKTAENR